MSLPIHKDDSKGLMAMQTTWASMLDPVLKAPITQGRQIDGVVLASGTTMINHRLGEKLRGWVVVGSNGIANIYDQQASNPTPNLTLILISDAIVTVSLWVY